jgi:hypothetical protein
MLLVQRLPVVERRVRDPQRRVRQYRRVDHVVVVWVPVEHLKHRRPKVEEGELYLVFPLLDHPNIHLDVL